jgi:hypothetical protein
MVISKHVAYLKGHGVGTSVYYPHLTYYKEKYDYGEETNLQQDYK